MSQEDNDDLLEMSASLIEPSELYKRLKAAEGLSECELNDAIDELPDKTKLVNLYIKFQCSRRRRDKRLLEHLTISELLSIIKFYPDKTQEETTTSGSSGSTEKIDERINNLEIDLNDPDPKNALIEKILNCEEALNRALTIVHEKLNVCERDNYMKDIQATVSVGNERSAVIDAVECEKEPLIKTGYPSRSISESSFSESNDYRSERDSDHDHPSQATQCTADTGKYLVDAMNSRSSSYNRNTMFFSDGFFVDSSSDLFV